MNSDIKPNGMIQCVLLVVSNPTEPTPLEIFEFLNKLLPELETQQNGNAKIGTQWTTEPISTTDMTARAIESFGDSIVNNEIFIYRTLALALREGEAKCLVVYDRTMDDPASSNTTKPGVAETCEFDKDSYIRALDILLPDYQALSIALENWLPGINAEEKIMVALGGLKRRVSDLGRQIEGAIKFRERLPILTVLTKNLSAKWIAELRAPNSTEWHPLNHKILRSWIDSMNRCYEKVNTPFVKSAAHAEALAKLRQATKEEAELTLHLIELVWYDTPEENSTKAQIWEILAVANYGEKAAKALKSGNLQDAKKLQQKLISYVTEVISRHRRENPATVPQLTQCLGGAKNDVQTIDKKIKEERAHQEALNPQKKRWWQVWK